MPGLVVLRPADANEVAEAWKLAVQLRAKPTALVLSRQALPTLDRTKYAAASGVSKGAYILADAPGGKPEVILMATGSEVSLCINAYEQLKSEGKKARVVSVPSWETLKRRAQITRNRCFRRRSKPAWRWKWHPRSDGRNMWLVWSGCGHAPLRGFRAA